MVCIGDALKYYESRKFSTVDRDNDEWLDGSCAEKYKAGWWYNAKCLEPGGKPRIYITSTAIEMKLKPAQTVNQSDAL